MNYFLKIALTALVFLNSCSTSYTNSKTYNQKDIENRIYEKITISAVDKNKISSDINKFYSILKTGRALSEADLKLHDSLFEAYKSLKYRPKNNIILLPAHTQINILLKSYCLDSEKASPSKEEVFQWNQPQKDILYLEQILKLSSENKYPQTLLQELIWNIKNKTYWNNYPSEHQKILNEIDKDAKTKIPNEASKQFKNLLINEAYKNIPEEISGQINLAEGQFHGFNFIKDLLEGYKSNKTLPEHRLTYMPESNGIYVSHLSKDFSEQEINFYNTSDKAIKIDFLHYEQSPVRNDVQRLAVYSIDDNELTNLSQKLEKLLYNDAARLGYGFVPVVNDLIDLYEATTGKDFFTNDTLSSIDRFLSALAVVAGNAEAYRQAAKILHGPPNYMADQLKKERRAKNPESLKALEKLADELSTKGLPDTWRTEPSKIKKANQGWEYTHPDNSEIRIRVMPGNPSSPHKNSQKPYIIVKKNADLYDKYGNIGKKETADTHIPIEDFDFKIFKRILKND